MFHSLELRFLARVTPIQERHLLAVLPDERALKLAVVVDQYLRRHIGRHVGRTLIASGLASGRAVAGMHRELAVAAKTHAGSTVAVHVRNLQALHEQSEHVSHVKSVKEFTLAILVESKSAVRSPENPIPASVVDPINEATFVRELASIFDFPDLIAHTLTTAGDGGITVLPYEEWLTRYLLSRQEDGLFRVEHGQDFGAFMKQGIEIRAAFYSYPAWCSINDMEEAPGRIHEGYLAYVRRFRLLELLFVSSGAVFLPVPGCRHGRYLTGIASDAPIREGVFRNDVLALGARIAFGQLHFELNEYTNDQLGTVFWEAVLQRGSGAVLEQVQFYPMDSSGVRAVNQYVEQRTLQLGCECVRRSVEINQVSREQQPSP